MRFRIYVVALRAGVEGHRLELVVDLLHCNRNRIILLPGGAPVVLVEVQDKKGEVGRFPFDVLDGPCH